MESFKHPSAGLPRRLAAQIDLYMHGAAREGHTVFLALRVEALVVKVLDKASPIRVALTGNGTAAQPLLSQLS